MAKSECEYWIHEEVKVELGFGERDADTMPYQIWLRGIEPQDMWKYNTPCNQCERCHANNFKAEKKQSFYVKKEPTAGELRRNALASVSAEKSGWDFEEKK